MAAGKYNFTIEQGTTVDFEVVYKDSNNVPINLSDYDGRMQIKDKIGGSTTHITLSSSLAEDNTGLNFKGSNNVNPLSSGSIGVFISANSSSAFNFTPVVTRILEGVIKLSKEVTTVS